MSWSNSKRIFPQQILIRSPLPESWVVEAHSGNANTTRPDARHISTWQTAKERLTRLGEDHIKFANLAGTAIRNPQDEEIGIVSDIVLDEKGRVAAIVVTTGEMMGIGGETKALSWNDMQVRRHYGENGEYNIIVDMSQEELESLPNFEDERRTTDKR